MTVSDIQGNKIKISLTDVEVLSCFGSYERLFSMTKAIKSAVQSLLEDIIAQKGYADCEKMLVEIKAKKNCGCIITVSLLSGNTQKSYIFEFADSESLTRAVVILYKDRRTRRLESRLYKMPQGFRLIIFSREYKPVFFLLNEFCRRQNSCPIELAYTEEYGKPLISENAIEIYGSAFTQSS